MVNMKTQIATLFNLSERIDVFRNEFIKQEGVEELVKEYFNTNVRDLRRIELDIQDRYVDWLDKKNNSKLSNDVLINNSLAFIGKMRVLKLDSLCNAGKIDYETYNKQRRIVKVATFLSGVKCKVRNAIKGSALGAAIGLGVGVAIGSVSVGVVLIPAAVCAVTAAVLKPDEAECWIKKTANKIIETVDKCINTALATIENTCKGLLQPILGVFKNADKINNTQIIPQTQHVDAIQEEVLVNV